jgi:hypothetical protein
MLMIKLGTLSCIICSQLKCIFFHLNTHQVHLVLFGIPPRSALTLVVRALLCITLLRF